MLKSIKGQMGFKGQEGSRVSKKQQVDNQCNVVMPTAIVMMVIGNCNAFDYSKDVSGSR